MLIHETSVVHPVSSLSGASVTTAQLTLSRKIGCGCTMLLAHLGADTVLGLHLVEEAVADWSDPVVLDGSCGSIELAQGGRLMRALTGIDIGADDASNDPRRAWLQAALLGRLAGTPFSGADRLHRSAPVQSADTFTVRMSLRSEQHAFSTHARASASTWLDFIARSSWIQEQRPASEFHHLPCRTTVRIARHTLPHHVLRTLAAGDIILPDSPNFSSDGEGRLQWGGLTARVRYVAPCSLEITAVEGEVELQEAELETMEERSDRTPAAPQAQSDSQAQSDPASLDMVPVTLDFELGQVRMLMGEVRQLAVGAIVPLANGSPASIAIVSGGCTLGRGEVVDVNGQLGIRIAQWGLR